MRRLFLLVALIGSAATVSAQEIAPRTKVAPAVRLTVARARRLVADTMKALNAPGASICIMKDGRIIWSEGFGFADLEQHVPVTTQTRFRIGSVSKPLTAAALGHLLEEGKLDLDAPVQRYVPSFPQKAYPITVREVAGHLAGFRHYRGAEFANQHHYASLTDGLQIFENDSLLFEPGTKFAYSSYGWNLLGAVVEGASGEPYLQYMTESVILPAHMTHTVPDEPDSLVPSRAHFYTWSDSMHRVLNAPYVDNSYKWSSGGFLSTAEDLASFGESMLEGRLLKPETVHLFWTSQHTRDGAETHNGIGWFVQSDSTGLFRISHSGGAMGGTAFLVIYPERHLVAALLVNSDHTFTGATPRIAEMFLDPAR
ncbi:MAG: serine hydrolase domain-containing protein [Gemmatimonadota bacterium]